VIQPLALCHVPEQFAACAEVCVFTVRHSLIIQTIAGEVLRDKACLDDTHQIWSLTASDCADQQKTGFGSLWLSLARRHMFSYPDKCSRAKKSIFGITPKRCKFFEVRKVYAARWTVAEPCTPPHVFLSR